MVKDFRNKNILIMGLGTLGGGVATVKWLLSHGAKITVTDTRKRAELMDSIRLLGSSVKKIRFVLGRHDKKDFISHDVIVVNPAVRIRGNKFLAIARKKKIPIINDLGIFFDNAKNPIVAITGTRGKTTTTNWIAYFLSKKFRGTRASGNSSGDAFLKLFPRLKKNIKMPAVIELSSFQLEVVNKVRRAPDIAIITNLYRDHLNRHDTMKEYTRVKANIFKNQTENQKLILNADDAWVNSFVRMRPKSKIYYVSRGKKKVMDGIKVGPKGIVFCAHGKNRVVFSPKEKETIESLGAHNVYNFLFAALTAHLMGVSWKEMSRMIKKLPVIKYRQEIVIKKKNLIVINDTTATSPEGAIAALNRFGGMHTFFIAGGTDKKLEYGAWALVVKKKTFPKNLFLLDGSATKKMVRELKKKKYFSGNHLQIFDSLEDILSAIKNRLRVSEYSPMVIVFSPGAASFEKFKNEFDRGEKFNAYIKKSFT